MPKSLHPALMRYTAVTLFIALIYLLIPPLSFSQSFDPEEAFSADVYKKMADSPVQKNVSAPPHRETDTSKTIEEIQLRHFQKLYPTIPSWRILQVMRSCSLLATCVIPNELEKIQKETVKMTKRKAPPPWYAKVSTFVKQKVLNPASRFLASLPRALWSKFKSVGRGLLAFFDRFMFWKNGTVAGEFVQKNVIKPSIVITKAIMKTAVNVVKNAKELGPPLLIVGHNNYYNKFKYPPDDSRLPLWSRDVSSWDNIWNPKYNIIDPIQCVAFVSMVYNGAGISLRDVKGNAVDWKNYTNKFNVYKSAESKTLPQKGDIMGWDDNPHGHVGIVTDAKPSSKKNTYLIEVTQSNSYKVTTTYNMIKKSNGSFQIINSTDNVNFLPDWWLRLKEFDK